MDWLGLALGAVVVLVLLRVLTRGSGRRQEQAAEEDAPHRVAELSAAFTGDPARDRALQNRLLSLGPSIVPRLVAQLGALVKDPDGFRPVVLARHEELIADFGLSAVPPTLLQLVRLQPTSPLCPSLLRVLGRLGQPGAVAVLRAALDWPQLAPFLPRWRIAWTPRMRPAEAIIVVLRQRPPGGRRADLDTLAGLLFDQRSVVLELWQIWDAEGRATLLDFFADWLPLLPVELLRAGLADPEPVVRCAAARVATLHFDPETATVLAALCNDPAPEVRRAAARAIAAQPHAAAQAAMVDALATADADTGLLAFASASTARPNGVPGYPPAHHVSTLLGDDPRGAWVRAVDAGDAEALLGALDAPNAADRVLPIRLLGRLVPTDARVKERLILAVDSQDADERAAAVLALAAAGENTTPELLARAVRDQPSREALLSLQEAAQVLGEAAAIPLARRLRADPPGRLDTVLAVLRATRYEAAVAPLLRGLESARGAPTEGLVSATLHAGGPATREALRASVRNPGRGLLAPAFAYLAAYASPDDLPLLVELFDRHPPLRGVAMTLIEAQGSAAIPALEARIAKGGDETLQTHLEQRLALLRAVG